MKFTRYLRVPATPAPNPKQIARSAKAIERQASALPLFADEITGQESPEARAVRIASGNRRQWQTMRDQHAGTWRRARQQLRNLPIDQQRAFIERWNGYGGPRSSEYFADMLHQFVNGKLAPLPSPAPTATQLAAQVRALKRHGAYLSAERDMLMDGIEAYEDGIYRLIDQLQQQQQRADTAEAELARCREFRHKLLMKLKEARSTRRQTTHGTQATG